MKQSKAPARLTVALSAAAALTLLVPAAHAAPDFFGKKLELNKVRSLSKSPARTKRTVRQVKPITRVVKTTPRQEAYQLLRAGDRTGALKAFGEVVADNPEDFRTWRVIGDIHYGMDQHEKAINAWGHALEQRPRMMGLLDRIARANTFLGDFDAAVEHEGLLVQRLRDSAERNPHARRVDLGTGQRQTVKENLRRHLMILSELAVLAGDYTKGEKAAYELIGMNRHAIDGYLSLAYVHLQAGDFEDAEDLYLNILEAAPANTIALNNLGNIYYMREDLESAAVQFEAILGVGEASPHSRSIALANLAELAQLEGDFEGAEVLYKDAIEAKPSGAWSYMGLAALRDLTGDYDAAVEAMIDGWERDRSTVTRLNMHFYQDEWYWQRDALIAEIEGNALEALELWKLVLRGQVSALHEAAAWHIDALSEQD